MRLAVIACFLNEERYLPQFLESLEHQLRAPDELLLVDDGSSDRSAALATSFAERRSNARVLSRQKRPAERDRLALAAELVAFNWAVERLERPWDVVAKLDADLRLTEAAFADTMHRLEEDPRLGLAGFHLSVEDPDGTVHRERCPEGHVRGATKFYRRACWDQIAPLRPILGWDTIDEVTARMHGWHTASFPVRSGDPIHLRPTSIQDGRVRGQLRLGAAAYAYGAAPLWVLAGTAHRCGRRSIGLAGVAYLGGYVQAAVKRAPRAPAGPRIQLRREHRRRAAERLRRRVAGRREPKI